VTRLVILQVVDSPGLSREAQGQHQKIQSVEPGRGIISDRRESILAINSTVPSLYGDPLQCSNPRETARAVASVLGLNADHIEQKLRSQKSFVWIKRRIDDHAADQLSHIDGIGVIKEPQRVYPNGDLLAHVLGFARVDGDAREGLESKYDQSLRGKRGRVVMDRDALGRPIFSKAFEEQLPAVGHDIVLTIDKSIQYVAETALDEGIELTQAKGGSVIVMDPGTGEILAMTARPTFDPNAMQQHVPEQWRDHGRNRVVTDYYEPGSTLKIVSAAAALNEGIFHSDDRVFTENGRYRIPGTKRVFTDATPHDWLTFSEIIERSSNIGMVKITQKLGEESFSKYLHSFGFGEKTGIDLAGESYGLLQPRERWSRGSLASLAIGYEVGVTPLQLITAAAALANGGFMMQPYLVAEIRDGDGHIVRSVKPYKKRKAISTQTAAEMTEILSRVVSQGTATRASLPSYVIAGKTGTARKFDPEIQSYSQDKLVSSFFGFFPARHPQLIILVIIDEPQTASFGGVVAAPVFRRIAEQAVSHFNILPDVPKRDFVVVHATN
tara:strand:+ start:6603 stop:8264 length:1662 start_codon:yes stop_codon:yes gene_type:complete